ncbi:hypothetical protein Tco_1471725 [Tanacetum coccineum]
MEAVEDTSGEQVDYHVDEIDSAYETQYHVEYSEDAGTNGDDDKYNDLLVDEENEIVEPDVDVHLFGISKDVSFDNIGVTSLVLEDVLEGENVNVENLDGFDSDTACRRTHCISTTEDDLEVFSTDDLGLDWISAHNFLTCFQQLSVISKFLNQLHVLKKLHFLALLVMSKFSRICFSFVILEVPLSEYFGFDMSYALNFLCSI